MSMRARRMTATVSLALGALVAGTYGGCATVHRPPRSRPVWRERPPRTRRRRRA